MVQYECKICGKTFDKKHNYEVHINRKNPCKPKEEMNTDNTCEYCGKILSRKDHLLQHYNSCKKYKMVSNNNKIINKGSNNNLHTENNTNSKNNNNNTYNQNITIHYNVLPFCKDGIDFLSTEDKFHILSPENDPIIALTERTNLNPELPIYHNVGYNDKKSGYGCVFTGKKWETKKISSIMNELLCAKGKDISAIYDDVKDCISPEQCVPIKKIVDSTQDTIKPKHNRHMKDKELLVGDLKSKFYDNRHLAIDSKKRFHNCTKNKSSVPPKKNYSNMIKEGMTMEEVDKILKDKKIYREKITLLKNIIEYLLKLLNENNIKISIKEQMDNTQNATELNEIINSLALHIYLGKELVPNQKPNEKTSENIQEVPKMNNENLKLSLQKLELLIKQLIAQLDKPHPS
jgi:hypothetical protein